MGEVCKLKGGVNSVMKVLSAIKGSRPEWTSVMQAWRSLARDHPEGLARTPGIIAFLVKREVLETAKFSKFEGMVELMDLMKPMELMKPMGPLNMINHHIQEY